MANVFDVAEYILSQTKDLTAMKLQKLVYYSQAWNLVWEDAPLFNEKIEAWEKGPVCPDLYKWHAGEFLVSSNENLKRLCAHTLSQNDKENIDRVINAYKKYTAYELSYFTHQELPWRVAFAKGQNTAISLADMHEYYASLK